MLKGREPASAVRRGMRHVSVGAALLLMVLMCTSWVPPARGAPVSSLSSTTSTSSTSPISANLVGNLTIDKQQFVATVPSYGVLGENYSLRVVIQSSANITVPIIVQLSVPVDGIFAHPRVVHANVQPMGSTVANFTILPFGPVRSGPYNVTALLYVFFPQAMSSPLLVDKATATVSTIGPNPFPYLQVALISAGVVTLVLVAVFYPRVFRRGSGSSR